VTVIGAVRDGHPGPFLSARFPRLDIGGLDDAAAQRILLSCAGDLSAADRGRIQQEALGNPLALLELPASWRVPDPPSTDRQHPRLSARLERAFVGRITELPAGTRDAVLVAAIDASGDLAEILAATAVLRGTPTVAGVLAPAAEASVLVL